MLNSQPLTGRHAVGVILCLDFSGGSVIKNIKYQIEIIGQRNLTLKIQYKIWLEEDGRVLFGIGRDELLKAIAECRSLNAAAKKLNMSYRAAWGRLKASEKRLGIPLVEIESQKQGMRLTEQAEALLKAFEELHEEVGALIAERTQQLSFLCAPADKKPESSESP